MLNINDYAVIVGQNIIDELHILGQKLQEKTVQNINSTAVGGGVAEILTRMVPLLRQLGVNARWDVMKGNEKFFNITKKFHNALHGVNEDISSDDLRYFLEVNRENAEEINSFDDIVFIHDPQPIALIEKKKDIGKKWVWRCHIDFTDPQPDIMNFLKSYIEKYDSAVFSAPAFSKDISIPQILISPSLDPLSDKDRPIVTQISRFDYLKDPLGVIEVYKKVKKYIDIQLVLAGGGATDDPEGMKVLEGVRSKAADDRDIHVILLPPSSDIEINALQRASTVILQKSLKEGFGLTVSEALWKAKPVIASAVGGIPL